MRYLWKYLKIDVISLIETQINNNLLDSTQNVYENLFRSELQASLFSYNKNEIINKRQQGGILTSIYRDTSKLVAGIGSDPLGLGKWNWIDLEYNNIKTRFITSYQYVQSR